jgi:rhodanese-related sulfurtransferase
MRKLILIGLTLLISLQFTGLAQGVTYHEIKTLEVKKMMDGGDVLVIYPLSKIEYNDLQIKGSVHIPLTKLADKLPQDKNKQLIFYCLDRK